MESGGDDDQSSLGKRHLDSNMHDLQTFPKIEEASNVSEMG